MKKDFPWVQDYFTARVLLGFSEDEFWESTPRKIYALKLCQNRYFSAKSPEKSVQNQVEEIKSLLGIII